MRLTAALLASFTLTANAGQTPAVPTAVSGRVLAVDTGTALVSARVTLTGPNDFHAVTLTRADDGGFTFASVPAGVYRLSATKPGYVPTEFGAPGFGRAGALRVDSQPPSDIQIRLARGAAVSGRVLDPEGDPAIGQTVAATWGGDESGRGAVAIAATRTDDLGEYRLGGLQHPYLRRGLASAWTSAGLDWTTRHARAGRRTIRRRLRDATKPVADRGIRWRDAPAQ